MLEIDLDKRIIRGSCKLIDLRAKGIIKASADADNLEGENGRKEWNKNENKGIVL